MTNTTSTVRHVAASRTDHTILKYPSSFADHLCQPRWLVFIILCVPASVHAADTTPSLHGLGSDRSEVASLLEHADDAAQLSELKLRWIYSHRRRDLPPGEVLTQIQDAVGKASHGSRKWYALLSAQALLQARMRWPAAVAVYGSLLQDPDTAFRHDAGDIVLQASAEYISELQRQPMPRPAPDVTVEVLGKALRAYGNLSDRSGGPVDNPDWGVAAGDARDDCERIALAWYRDTAHVLFWRAMAAAELLQEVQRAEAPDALAMARKAIVPGNKVQAAAYYSYVVRRLEFEDRFSEAAEAQKQLVAVTGHGFGVLATLHARSKDFAAFDADLAQLRDPRSDENDVLAAAAFFTLTIDHPARPHDEICQKTIDLMGAYLRARRPRTPANEANIRLLLGSLFVEEDRMAEAQEVLSMDGLAARLDPTYASDIRLRAKRLLSANAHSP